MLFGKKKNPGACMSCGGGKKIDGDELMCATCINEINLAPPSNLIVPNEEGFDLPRRVSNGN